MKRLSYIKDARCLKVNKRKAQGTLSYMTLSTPPMLSGIKESRMGKFPQSFELTLAAGRTKKFKFGPPP